MGRGHVKGTKTGPENRDLLFLDYTIHNKAQKSTHGRRTRGVSPTTLLKSAFIHANGPTESDTRNLYGIITGTTSSNTKLERRPNVRSLIISYSSPSSSGNRTGHWQGDNESKWDNYRANIRQCSPRRRYTRCRWLALLPAALNRVPPSSCARTGLPSIRFLRSTGTTMRSSCLFRKSLIGGMQWRTVPGRRLIFGTGCWTTFTRRFRGNRLTGRNLSVRCS